MVITKREKLEGRYGGTYIEGLGVLPGPKEEYNIAPSQHTPLITSDEPEHISIGHWGFRPSWARDKEMKEVINARAETVTLKPYFRSDIKTHRCLVPATGFYEWQRTGKKKIPYRFFMKTKDIFSMAGLYSIYLDENGVELPHFSIITTNANSLMEPIHNRMPVIIQKEDESDWLDTSLNLDDMTELLTPLEPDLMQCYEIFTLVNNPKNNSPLVIKKV